jgi:predicted nucleic acid-binding protein
MAIIIDTSALLAVLLNESHKPAIIKATEKHDLQAPVSLDGEVGNALSAMFKNERITLEQAQQVLSKFYIIPIRRTKLRIAEAVKIAYTHNIYAWDAYMLDCALQYNAPLLSLDKQMIRIANQLELSLIEVYP